MTVLSTYRMLAYTLLILQHLSCIRAVGTCTGPEWVTAQRLTGLLTWSALI